MGFFPAKDPVLGDAFSCDAIDMTIVPRTADLGGLTVRRARLSARRRDRLARALRRGDLVPHAHRRGAQGGGGIRRDCIRRKIRALSVTNGASMADIYRLGLG